MRLANTCNTNTIWQISWVGCVCSLEDIVDQLTCAGPVVRICVLSFAPRRFASSLQQPENWFPTPAFNPFGQTFHYRLQFRFKDHFNFTLTTTVFGCKTTETALDLEIICFFSFRFRWVLQDVAYPACMQNMQSVDEWHYALLQCVQCMLLWVMVSEVVPQAPESISEQLDLLCLHTHTQEQKHDYLTKQ